MSAGAAVNNPRTAFTEGVAGSFAVSMVASLAYYASGLWRRSIGRKPMPPSPQAAFGEETGEA